MLMTRVEDVEPVEEPAIEEIEEEVGEEAADA
jgi:hypothetical protein